MTNEELLEMVSKLSTELVDTKKALEVCSGVSIENSNLLRQLDEKMTKANVPQMHIANRLEWVLERTVWKDD
jgi:hypothetical protein